MRFTFSRASAAAAGECSTATILSNCPSTASASAMQPDPVPMSATRPITHLASTSPTSPSLSGRGINARRSIAKSIVRNPTRPTAYANGTPRSTCATASRYFATSSGDFGSSRRSQASPTVVPATAAQTSLLDQSDTDALLLLRLSHGGDQVIELPIQHLIHAVRREVDPMIGHAILRKVVRADLLRAVTRAHLCAALARTRRLLLRHHAVEQARAQDLHRLDFDPALAQDQNQGDGDPAHFTSRPVGRCVMRTALSV